MKNSSICGIWTLTFINDSQALIHRVWEVEVLVLNSGL